MTISSNFYSIATHMLECIRADYDDDIPFFQRMDEVVDNSEYGIYYYQAQRLILDEMTPSQQANAEWELGEFSNTLTYNEFACLIACQAIKHAIIAQATAAEVGE